MFLRWLVLDDIVESIAIIKFGQLFHSFQFSFLEECLILSFQFNIFFSLAGSFCLCIVYFVFEFFDFFVQHSNLVFSLAEFIHFKTKSLIFNLFHLSHIEKYSGLLSRMGVLFLKFKFVLDQFLSFFIHNLLNFSKFFKCPFFLFVFVDLDSQVYFGTFN